MLMIIIAFLSFLGLIVLHELGHFILAKKFGVKVEEFGIGYPPRLFGKKIGETIYSLNLLPFGAFVRIYGESEEIKDADNQRSFGAKPIWQRALIVLGGVMSFWIVSIILLSIVMALGAPTVIGDEDSQNLVNPKVQITAVASGSPAEIAGLKVGDTVRQFSVSGQNFTINKVAELQSLIEQNKGKEVVLTVERGKETLQEKATPRISPPEGQGPMGVALIRTALKSFPWYRAPFEGIIATANLTASVFIGWGQALKNVFIGKPTGVQLVGPVGIFSLFAQVSQLGIVYFLQFIAIISVYLAVFNILPIPAVDGGKILFLIIEKIRKKPVPPKIEQNISSVFFILLLAMMIWVTVKDVIHLF